jgi:hypothetical protein
MTDRAVQPEAPRCEHVFTGTTNRCGTEPRHPVHIYGEWSGPEEYHAFAPARAASQERPQPIHVKHDDWWCECGSRVEDCDYLQENLRAQERPSIDVDALRLAAEALSEALLPTTGGYHTPAEPVQALRRILRSVASPEPRDE